MPQRAPRRHLQRGQTLIIFALVATVLFAVVGLGVDGGFSYFASDKLERGAMAGALAGVPDMPDFNAAPNDAVTTAIAAVTKNGWATGGTNNVAVTVAQVTDPNTGQPYRNRLAVTVAADVPAFFMRLLGIQSHREARTAVAEYLRPITFGQPGSQLGSSVDALGTGANFYFMRSEGWSTDRGQGDAYGPNPTDWGGANSASPADVHALSGSAGLNTEPASQPFALPAAGGQNYQVYIPPGQTGTAQVYNPAFAPDNGTTSANGYNYHEDDGDFVETGAGCTHGNGQGSSPCSGPTDARAWPVMSYTVYQSPNPFDHTQDMWISNMTVKSIDATANPSSGTYTAAGTANPVLPVSGLSLYHNWVDIRSRSTMTAADKQLAALIDPSGTDVLTGAAVTGTTYRLRVDQLDNTNFDPGGNGRARNLNSQAHKGYAVNVAGCAGCSVAALDDVTLYTPIKAGGGSMPLVSIPPEYSGRTFSLYIFDPGDVGCQPGKCSNVITVMRPNGVTGGVPNPEVAATNSDGVFYGGASQQAGGFNLVTGANNPSPPTVGGAASLQTQDPSAGTANIYNGKWVRFDIQIPANYETADVSSTDPTTWFWQLNYTTALAAGDTITANLGFVGAPVHLLNG
ncbi:MAG: pilus assembly protein TadG-related protein [Candidatus Dormibacter sp.]